MSGKEIEGKGLLQDGGRTMRADVGVVGSSRFQQQSSEVSGFRLRDPSPIGQGQNLASLRNWSIVVPQLVVRSAEMRGRSKRTKAAHGPVALLDTAMILLDEHVQVATCTMQQLIAEFVSQRPRMGVVSLGSDVVWGCPRDRERLVEVCPSGSQVTLIAQATVDEISVPVDCPIQTAPSPADLHVRLVDIPARPTSFAPQGVGEQRGESTFPLPYSLNVELEPSLQGHLRQVP